MTPVKGGGKKAVAKRAKEKYLYNVNGRSTHIHNQYSMSFKHPNIAHDVYFKSNAPIGEGPTEPAPAIPLGYATISKQNSTNKIIENYLTTSK